MFLLFVSAPLFVMIKMPFVGIEGRLLVLNILERSFNDLIQFTVVQPYHHQKITPDRSKMTNNH